MRVRARVLKQLSKFVLICWAVRACLYNIIMFVLNRHIHGCDLIKQIKLRYIDQKIQSLV